MFYEFYDWPEAVAAVALNQPIWSAELEPGPPLALPDPFDLPDDLPDLLFAKLGPKSWRNRGSVGPIPSQPDLVAEVLGRRLASPTEAQVKILAVMEQAGEPLRLYLYPWRDMTGINEYRLRCAQGAVWISSALERHGARPELYDLVVAFGAELHNALLTTTIPLEPPADEISLDVALTVEGHLRLIDVNPAGPLAEL